MESASEYTMAKKLSNGLYLSQEQMDILEKYNINYQSCHSLKELIYYVETCFEETNQTELDNLLDILAERDYYENFRK